MNTFFNTILPTLFLSQFKKINLFFIVTFFLSGFLFHLNASSNHLYSLSSKWYKIKHKAENDPEFYGKGISIKKVFYEYKSRWRCEGKHCFKYSIVLNRPSNDNGAGVVYLGTTPFKIQYWIGDASTYDNSFYSAFKGGYDISLIASSNPKEIILSFNKALVPGRYYFKIAPFPYPSTYGSSIETFMKYYRHDYNSYFEELYKYFYKFKKLKDSTVDLVWGKIQDVSIDGLMISVANKYGIYLILDVPAIMPDIIGRDVEIAHKELLVSSLKPNRKNWDCTKTNIKTNLGKVYKTQYKAGKKLKKNQKVEYYYYCKGKSMPDIKGMFTKDADKALIKSGLIPSPGKCVPTENKKLNNKVFKQQYETNEDLLPNQKVAYKYYCYKKNKLIISSANYDKCPKQNPGNKNYSNYKNSDGTRIHCRYFNDGILSSQETYKNGKKNGATLVYAGRSPHLISSSKNYKNGLLDGKVINWFSNSSTKSSEFVYSMGKKVKAIKWHKNGNVSTKIEYKSNGRAHLQHNYNSKGEFTYCTQWDNKGKPMDCKTKKYR